MKLAASVFVALASGGLTTRDPIQNTRFADLKRQYEAVIRAVTPVKPHQGSYSANPTPANIPERGNKLPVKEGTIGKKKGKKYIDALLRHVCDHGFLNEEIVKNREQETPIVSERAKELAQKASLIKELLWKGQPQDVDVVTALSMSIQSEFRAIVGENSSAVAQIAQNLVSIVDALGEASQVVYFMIHPMHNSNSYKNMQSMIDFGKKGGSRLGFEFNKFWGSYLPSNLPFEDYAPRVLSENYGTYYLGERLFEIYKTRYMKAIYLLHLLCNLVYLVDTVKSSDGKCQNLGAYCRILNSLDLLNSIAAVVFSLIEIASTPDRVLFDLEGSASAFRSFCDGNVYDAAMTAIKNMIAKPQHIPYMEKNSKASTNIKIVQMMIDCDFHETLEKMYELYQNLAVKGITSETTLDKILDQMTTRLLVSRGDVVKEVVE